MRLAGVHAELPGLGRGVALFARQSQASALFDCAKANTGTQCFARVNNCNSN